MPHILLLADDNPAIQRLLELTLSDEDVLVVAVDSGDAAIASLNRAAADIVLADVGLPIRSGYEVASHVKQTPALWHVPVLLLAGAFEPVDAVRAAESGCDGVLTKPLEPQVVVRRVRELLHKAAGAPEAPRAPEPVASRQEAPTHDSPWQVAFETDVRSLQVDPPRVDLLEPEPSRVESEEPRVARADSGVSEGERFVWIRTEPPVETVESAEPVRFVEHVETPAFDLGMSEDIAPWGSSSELHSRTLNPPPEPPAQEAPAAAQPPAHSEVESYFEELDLAFSSLNRAPREPLPPSDHAQEEALPPAAPAVARLSLARAFASLLAAETASPPEAVELEAPKEQEVLALHEVPMEEAKTDDAGEDDAGEDAGEEDREDAKEDEVASEAPVWVLDEDLYAMPTLTEPATVEHTLDDQRPDDHEPDGHQPDSHTGTGGMTSEEAATAVVSQLLQSPALSSDQLVERVTRLALERLPNDAVRTIVERVVSDTAERLIREEIERIKSNIK